MVVSVSVVSSSSLSQSVPYFNFHTSSGVILRYSNFRRPSALIYRRLKSGSANSSSNVPATFSSMSTPANLRGFRFPSRYPSSRSSRTNFKLSVIVCPGIDVSVYCGILGCEINRKELIHRYPLFSRPCHIVPIMLGSAAWAQACIILDSNRLSLPYSRSPKLGTYR